MKTQDDIIVMPEPVDQRTAGAVQALRQSLDALERRRNERLEQRTQKINELHAAVTDDVVKFVAPKDVLERLDQSATSGLDGVARARKSLADALNRARDVLDGVSMRRRASGSP